MRYVQFMIGASLLTASLMAQSLPETITECEATQCDATWTFDGFNGFAQWADGSRSALTILRFDSGEVVITRRDGNGATAAYGGTVHGRAIDGEVNLLSPDGTPTNHKWSATINDRVWHVPDESNIPMTVKRCEVSNPSGVSGETAFLKGEAARVNGDPDNAFCWHLIGATQGEPTAQARVAAAYFAGANQDIAFAWARKSAAQGNREGELLVAYAYEHAAGTSFNQEEADLWRLKANDPRQVPKESR